MQIRRMAIENVRSFLTRQEILFDGQISILVGPNGGGKTNLLDTLVIMLRRYLLGSTYYVHMPQRDDPYLWQGQFNEQLNQLVFEKNSAGRDLAQVVELEIEVTGSDLENMRVIKLQADQVRAALTKRLSPDPWQHVQSWNIDAIRANDRINVTWRDGYIEKTEKDHERYFLQYLQLFEVDNLFRAETDLGALTLPIIYLPVNRTANGFQSTIGLSGFNDIDQKRSIDAVSSRSGSSILQLAVGRIAKKYRLLQENSNKDAKYEFYNDKNLIELSKSLMSIGYSWSLETIDALSNTYDIKLIKQGRSFLVNSASSGEREILTYLFVIFGLNVRNALIIVDEPELHLHPRWQKTLLDLFEKLSVSTGNQFVLTTHSPTFISPSSVQHVSRVFSKQQQSGIVRMNSSALPNSRHLFNLVNSQNNERIFFSDRVVLVEGVTDQIVFTKVIETVAKQNGLSEAPSLEIVNVGGKGLFKPYQMLLDACHVEWFTISDRDYLEQIGDEAIKGLFKADPRRLVHDVILNRKSRDGTMLFLAIENAIISQNFSELKKEWDYIKLRRGVMPDLLSPEQDAAVRDFVKRQESNNIFVLIRGALEAYLPPGYAAKDVELLTDFVNSPNFWIELPSDEREDLERIALRLLQPA